MKGRIVPSLAVGVGRYLQGPGVIGELPAEVEAAGGAPLVIGGAVGIDIVQAHLPAQGRIVRHTSGCTRAAASHYAQLARECGARTIVGVGGGVVIDLAKAVATLAQLPVVTVPTSIATCVACSSVCIMYDEDGRPDGSLSMPRGVWGTVADLDIIGAAPRRLLIAGVLDTMAKFPELRHERAHPIGTRQGRLNQASAVAISEQLYRLHLEHSVALATTNDPDRLAAATVGNLLQTAVVSGLCAGSGQLALAHAFYDWHRREYPVVHPAYLHGEIVGVGILMQLRFNKADDSSFRTLLADLGAPDSGAALGVELAPSQLEVLIDWLARVTDVPQASRAVLADAIESTLMEAR